MNEEKEQQKEIKEKLESEGLDPDELDEDESLGGEACRDGGQRPSHKKNSPTFFNQRCLFL